MIVSSIGQSYCELRRTIVKAGRQKDGLVGMDSVQSMASCSSSSVPSTARAIHFTSQTEIEMESSKARHWSQLDYSTTDSEWSAESNNKYFDLLKEDPERGRFFTDFETLEVGEKISGGAQADIYEARMTRDGPFDLVVKVMKGDAPLKAFQAQWPIGMLSARSKYKHLFDLPLITILGGTVLRDKRLRGRFAFVMYRRWGDLRFLIDRRMKQERSTLGPFSLDEAIHLMTTIAEDMAMLHNKHDILHRDLKASNVLVWGDFGEDASLIGPLDRVERIGSVVADFECSVGVLGTGFWRAPEILLELKDRVPRSVVQFTRASDVYSYGMTCYEIVTGCIPYDGLGGEDVVSQILEGRRPELPHELPAWVRNLIVGCWYSDLWRRPSFSDICMALKLKRGPNPMSVVIDNKSQRGASIIKVEQWNNPRPLTLLEVMQKLMEMDLFVLKAFDLSSTEMIMQCFEVTDCKGKKVVNDQSIAKITKALSLPIKMKWISESLETSINGTAIVQVHVIEVVAEGCANLLWVLSRHLVATNFRVHSAGCWTRRGRVECVIYVEGTRIDTLLWEHQRNENSFLISPKRFKMIVHGVAADELFHLNRRLHNLKSIDLTPPLNLSNLCVYQTKESGDRFCCTGRVVCLGKAEPLVHVSRTLAGMDYKIFQASIKYPRLYEFLGKANKFQNINVGTLGGDELEKIHRILHTAIERGCHEVNGQLIVFGPNEELHNDLMRSFQGVVVTRGEAYCVSDTKLYIPKRDLLFFVTEKPVVEAS